MPYCTSCGNEVTIKMLFCHKCGSKLIIPKNDFKDNKVPANAADAGVTEQEDTSSRGIRKGKLYKQWVKYAGLPHLKIASMRSSRGMPVRKGNNAQYPHLLYMLLGVAILLCIGLVLLLVKIW